MNKLINKVPSGINNLLLTIAKDPEITKILVSKIPDLSNTKNLTVVLAFISTWRISERFFYYYFLSKTNSETNK